MTRDISTALAVTGTFGALALIHWALAAASIFATAYLYATYRVVRHALTSNRDDDHTEMVIATGVCVLSALGLATLIGAGGVA